MNKKPFFSRYSLVILLSVLALLPVLLLNAKWAVQSNTNKVQDWIPATFSETGELKWFRQHFVADQFVVISWEGCELGGDPADPDAPPDDPRIEQLAETLVPSDPNSPHAAKYGKYFKTVNTARRVLNRITAPPAEVPYHEAVRRLTGTLIGPDGRSTAVLVNLSDVAVQDFRTAIGRGVNGLLGRNHGPGLVFEALAECGISADQAHLGGPPVDNVSIDEEGDRTMVRLVVAAMTFGLFLAWFSLRSLKLTLIVFACGLLSAMTGLALVHINGDKTDAVVLSMPSLLYILAISGSIHLINYYRDEVVERGLEGAPDRALAHGWRPALFCNLTTSIGLGSLYAAEIVPIRKFGIYSAWGVMATLVILFLYLPAALYMFPVRRLEKQATKGCDRKPSGFEEWLDHVWLRFGRWVIKNHFVVAGGCFLMTAVVGLGVIRMRTSIDLLKLFHPQARILHDYMWLEKHLGRLIPMEIVVRYTPSAQLTGPGKSAADAQRQFELSFLERMESVALVQEVIEKQFGEAGSDVVGRSMSAATFAPPVDFTGRSTSSFFARSTLNSRLEASRDEFAKSGFLQIDPYTNEELWRISLRVAAFENVDYGAFVRDIQQTVEPAIAAHQARGEVLARIMDQRQTDRYAGASVFIWNRSEEAASGADSGHRLHEQRIFADCLRTLLTRARLNVASNTADPGTVPVTQLERLQGYDCVVLVGEFSETDIAMIERHGGSVLDARRILNQQIATLHERDTSGFRAAPAGMAAVYTGVVPIVYKAQRALLDSLMSSTFYSFVTITPLLWFVVRSFGGGSVAMIPNILPVLFIFGGMGWLGFAVDIGAMMSASIALGVAVDDTIHYLTWFRDDLDKTGDRNSAILAAYRRCATPTTQAALVNGLGLSVFAMSTFMPTRKFGWLMLVILIAGLVAELVMMPAILAGPLGAFFRPRTKGRKQTAHEHEAIIVPLPAGHAIPGGPHRAPVSLAKNLRLSRTTGAQERPAPGT